MIQNVSKDITVSINEYSLFRILVLGVWHKLSKNCFRMLIDERTRDLKVPPADVELIVANLLIQSL